MSEWREFFGDFLKTAPAPAPASEPVVTDDSDAPPPPPPSPTCFKMGAWGLARGKVVRDRSTDIRSLSLFNADPGKADLMTADLHELAFGLAPEMAGNPADAGAANYLRAALTSPEVQSLRDLTVGSPDMAEMLATSLAFQYEGVLAAREKSAAKAGGTDPGMAAPPDGTPSDDEARCMVAVARAAEAAGTDIREFSDAMQGCGMGPGSFGQKFDAKKAAETARRVKNSRRLRDIMKRAGVFRRIGMSKQRTKLVHGDDELVGVTLTTDVARLLPCEKAALAHPDLRADAVRRLMDGETMGFEYRERVPHGEGPVVITLDESGSNANEKDADQKAFALEMARIARSQRRWCCVIAYSGDTGHRMLVLPPSGWPTDTLLDFMDHFIGGGSNIDVPVRELPDFYNKSGAPRGKTDVIMITDAVCFLPANVVHDFNAWRKKNQVRVTALVVRPWAGHNDRGSLALVCDGLHVVREITPAEGAVTEMFTI
jgi:hypothetical protein